MAEAEQDGTDRRSMVAAFVKEVRNEGGGPSKVMPRAWAVGLTVVVVGAGAVGVGMLAGGHAPSTAAAATEHTPTPTASSTTGAPDQPAPGSPGNAAPPLANADPGVGADQGGSGGRGGSGGGNPPGRPAPAPGGATPAAPGDNAPGIPAAGNPPAPRNNPAPPVSAAPPAPAPAAPALAAAKAPGYTAVAGYGCPTSNAQGFSEAGRYSDGRNGWFTVGAAGWAQDGCNGKFDAMPMSGDAKKDDQSNYALWTFSPGVVGLRTATCQVQLYVPNDKDITHVGGNPAHFEVYGSSSLSSPMLNSFDVSQPGHLGQWKDVGTFGTTTGVLMIKLDSRGQDWHGDTATKAHLAVAQMRATCS
ncbi:hypothetical protein [Kitasatospora sp. NPDC018619]|uniref:hypothetical protein n=1 Tax=unclassified Kitasatospora TaxID=2633591 RepID=UPI0037A9FC9A